MKTLKLHYNFPRFHASPLPLITLPTYHLITISLFLLFSTGLHSQNEANVWYFSRHCGLDCNSGVPIVLYNGQTIYTEFGNSAISDSNGNILFYTDWEKVYKKIGLMLNGDGMVCPDKTGRVTVQWPGEKKKYYVLTAAVGTPSGGGFHYSVVDMDLNNGEGEVIEKNTPIPTGWDASG